MATVDFTQLNALVADVQSKDQAFSDAKDAADASDQTLAVAKAASTQAHAGEDSAKSALSASVQALVTYVESLSA